MKKYELIIGRYLEKKLIINFTGIALVLCLIIFGNQFYIVGKESLKIGLYGNEIISFVFYKVARDLSLITILAFTGSILITFHKLNKTSEKIILHSCGIGNLDLFKSTSRLILIFFFAIFFLSNFISPWANQALEMSKNETTNRPSYLFFLEGQFQKFNDYTFYAKNVETNSDTQNAKNIFLFLNIDPVKFIYAKEGIKVIDKVTKDVILKLKNGTIYQTKNEMISSISNFESYDILLFENNFYKKNNIKTSIPGLSYENLLKNYTNEYKAEVFYRLSQPIFFLITSLVYIFICKSNPRDKSNIHLIYGFMLFIANFNLILISKKWIEDGTIPVEIGYIIPNLISLVILLIYFFKFNSIKSHINVQ